MKNKKTTAILVTGAAARISQEVACIDKLIENKGLVINEDNTMLAGFSSGSLNLLAMNACFRNDNPLSWDSDYKQNMLWNLTNSKVFTPNGIHFPVFDTKPLRKTLNSFLSQMGVTWYGDLPFDSYVITYSDRKLATEWANNFQETNQNGLNASDLFMASTAIPVAFPKQEISAKEGVDRNFPKGNFIDGGTGGTFKKFEDYIGDYVLENGAFDTLYIVSPMREVGDEDHNNSKPEKGRKISTLEKKSLEQFGANHSINAFMKFLEAIKAWESKNGSLANNIYVSIPKMDSNFGILDFNNEEEQYNTVCNWLDQNPDQLAVPLDVFIAQHVAVTA